MLATHDIYINKAETLNDYINSISKIRDLCTGKEKGELETSVAMLYKTSSKKLYEYNLIIITLYGVLESFIEQIGKEYLEELNRIYEKYSQLPQRIIDNHIVFSADLIKNSDRLSKYSHIQKDKVINNLHACVNNESNYSLNLDAFTYHSSNFRHDSIREFFSNLGIENITEGIKKDIDFRNYFVEKEAAEESDFQKYTDEMYFTPLTDLVERRNNIAHGSPPQTILSLDYMKNYVDYIIRLMNSIYCILYKRLLVYKIDNNKLQQLGSVEKVFRAISVVGIHSNHVSIKRGCLVVGIQPKTKELRYGHVESLEVDKKEVDEISNLEDKVVCLKVDFTAKENYNYFVEVE